MVLPLVTGPTPRRRSPCRSRPVSVVTEKCSMSRHTDRTAPRHDAPSTGGERTGGAPPGPRCLTLYVLLLCLSAPWGEPGDRTRSGRARPPRGSRWLEPRTRCSPAARTLVTDPLSRHRPNVCGQTERQRGGPAASLTEDDTATLSGGPRGLPRRGGGAAGRPAPRAGSSSPGPSTCPSGLSALQVSSHAVCTGSPRDLPLVRTGVSPGLTPNPQGGLLGTHP